MSRYADLDLTEEKRATKLAEAKAKYKKPFANDIPLNREKEPSIALLDLNKRSKDDGAQQNIIILKVKKQS